MPTLPSTTAQRYLQPLREGGSLPAVVETEDGLYVVKFRGAGQGPRALIAELIVGLLAQEVSLPVPELALVELPQGFGAEQEETEIRELLERSVGVNFGLRYLDGAFNFDGNAAGDLIEPDLAADVVWLDAFLTNPDRTPRNPNLLIWERRPWLIDHGSALYAQHAWDRVDDTRTRTPFPLIRDHILLLTASDLTAADRRMTETLTPARITAVLEAVPDALLMDPLARGTFENAEQARARYVRYLTERIASPRAFVEEAVLAQSRRRTAPNVRLESRR